MRLRLRVQAFVSTSVAEENDVANVDRGLVSDDFQEGGAVRVRVAGGATNLAVTLPAVASAGFVLIRTEAVDDTLAPVPLTVRLNDPAADPITIEPIGTDRRGFFLVTTDGVTAVYLSNADPTVAMYAHVVSVGDAT
jgi:hypothetical protein